MKTTKNLIIFFIILSSSLLFHCSGKVSGQENQLVDSQNPRVIVSTDIGGSDPDDFQSMIHYLMYADRFQTEGLISSPFYFDEGSTKDILGIIDLYEKDFDRLKHHGEFPSPDMLRSVTKQGDSSNVSLYKGWNMPTDGSEWIITQAKKESDQPLWILVWGGLKDVAQALHDSPDIANKIRVYWIGGPNKKWSVNSYLYIAQNFPDLWMIEANSTYRGWFYDKEASQEFTNEAFYENRIKNKGYLGTDFGKYYNGSIKMGDTPSVAYLLHGDPENPKGESWGGRFTKLPFSAYRVFQKQSTSSDTIPTYSVVEWQFVPHNEVKSETAGIWMKIDGQRINGVFDDQSNMYKVRFVPKRIGNWKYEINCTSEELHGKTGEFVSANPWPGEENVQNMKLNNWWSDRLEQELYEGEYQGAKSVSKWREEYLMDWAQRFEWVAK